jgi:hypothetical protein
VLHGVAPPPPSTTAATRWGKARRQYKTLLPSHVTPLVMNTFAAVPALDRHRIEHAAAKPG